MDAEEVPDPTRIRHLNDLFRCHGLGQGSILVTHGVNSVDDEFAPKAMAAVRAFDQFNEDNDPHGEHDFGALEVEGEKLFFKIDYYDLKMKMHSPNAANAAVTHRVLTIMHRSEY